MLKFLKHFGLKTAENTGSSIIDFLVSFDPETASEAEIDRLDEYLEDLTTKMIEAKKDYEREQKEYEMIYANYNRMFAAVEKFRTMEQTDQIIQNIDNLIDEMEMMKPEVIREKEEAEESKQYYEELQEAVKSAADKLKSARSDLKKAVRQMEQAEARQERLKEKEERAKVLAGIKKDTNKIGSALSAMQRRTDEMNMKVEVSQTKLKLLNMDNNTDKVTAALRMAEMDNNNSTNKPAHEDRLANLKI